MNIFIGSDHAGYQLKEYLRNTLAELGHRVIDCGAYTYNEKDDYPVYISKVAKAVSEAEELRSIEQDSPTLEATPRDISVSGEIQETRGIVIGGSGQGEAIVANKYKHVRAALCYGGVDADVIVTLSREHNNANVLSLGARFIPSDKVIELVLLWLNTPFGGDERHVRRLGEIEEISHTPLYE
ncbi:MAG: RpiB/LacA/LacB family sugar-phosphate isomerase [Candidatus Taylorbacteria bacterium]|nr:RpiB/LacA/LacB family sugar-phosphate isomerase [Candidatus Taylorbacteria bacterium]